MQTYRAYGLTFASDIALPELPQSSEAPVAFIKRQSLYGELGAEGNGGSCVTGRVLDVLRFRVEGGSTIMVDELKEVSEEEIRVYLLGVLMSILLRQRGLLVLHAAGLAKDGKAVAFVGDSGWGKSTLAGYFVQQGYRLLNDDVLALDVAQTPVQVIPGFPQIKFRPEAEQWLGARYADMPSLHENSPKRIDAPFERFQQEPLPISRLYVLEGGGRAESAIKPLGAREAILELVRHTRMTNMMRAPEVQTQHLQQCAFLVQNVPVQRLERKKDLNALGEILEQVEEDLSSADTAPQG